MSKTSTTLSTLSTRHTTVATSPSIRRATSPSTWRISTDRTATTTTKIIIQSIWPTTTTTTTTNTTTTTTTTPPATSTAVIEETAAAATYFGMTLTALAVVGAVIGLLIVIIVIIVIVVVCCVCRRRKRDETKTKSEVNGSSDTPNVANEYVAEDTRTDPHRSNYEYIPATGDVNPGTVSSPPSHYEHLRLGPIAPVTAGHEYEQLQAEP